MKTPSPSKQLKSQLKKSDPEIQAYVVALQSELAKLLKHNGRLEANNVTLHGRINLLEGELKECRDKFAPPDNKLLKKLLEEHLGIKT